MLFSFEQVAYTKLAYLLTFLISGQYYKLFTAVITLLAAYFSMILTELRQ